MDFLALRTLTNGEKKVLIYCSGFSLFEKASIKNMSVNRTGEWTSIRSSGFIKQQETAVRVEMLHSVETFLF